MLFSSNEMADYINETFEPAWESLRPAPLVTIDFGNGHTVKRTLQGNIATYVCDARGRVYDVLPGIYAPAVYRSELGALKLLVDSAHRKAITPTATGADTRTGDDSSVRLRDYHAREAARLGSAKVQPQMQAVAQTGGSFKGAGGGALGFSGGFNGVLASNNATGFQGSFGAGGAGEFGSAFGGIEGPMTGMLMGWPSAPAPGYAPPAVPLAARPELALDSQVNQLIRRRTIHERLARLDAVRPDDIKKWLFKEVLHADLDDPLLGLGPVLNDNYPFAEEDRAAAARKATALP